MDDKGDLVGAISFLGEEDDAGEGGDVVFDGAEGMVKVAGDFIGLFALEEEAHRLDAVGLTGADVLLLTACGDLDAAAAEGGDVADDGADAAVAEAVGQVFIAEESALVAGLAGQAENAAAA